MRPTGRRAVLPAAFVATVATLLALSGALPDVWLRNAALTAGGPLLLALIPVVAAGELRFRGRAARTAGTVVACEQDGVDEPRCAVTVEFTAVDGTPHAFTQHRTARRAVGSPVRVRYDPAAPDADARLDAGPLPVLAEVAVMAVVGTALTAYLFWPEWTSERVGAWLS
ncbi:DUF3592 domain-containing protein [Actinomadura atramentaria]|uniref:DUF3592 domain-containing protein n=1 Tax=Actinomadura atramentaria TaxID=1990 RepID=UPI0003741249|nr:DUF3592 domain-containing protein [Actinomadura atramentaria]